MLHRVRGPLALRAIALVTAVSLTATSGGLPMCISALAQAVAHCAMHGDGHHQGGRVVASLSLQLVAANGSQSCHPDADGLGCSGDRKSTRLNSSHRCISYAVFCLKKK